MRKTARGGLLERCGGVWKLAVHVKRGNKDSAAETECGKAGNKVDRGRQVRGAWQGGLWPVLG